MILQYKCCGVNGYEEWKEESDYFPTTSDGFEVPKSCCQGVVEADDVTTCQRNPGSSKLVGCFQKLKDSIERHKTLILSVSIAILIIMVSHCLFLVAKLYYKKAKITNWLPIFASNFRVTQQRFSFLFSSSLTWCLLSHSAPWSRKTFTYISSFTFLSKHSGSEVRRSQTYILQYSVFADKGEVALYRTNVQNQGPKHGS